MQATYDPTDDKIRVSFDFRQDEETLAPLKSNGFRWAPRQQVWFATWTPEREDAALQVTKTDELEEEGGSLMGRAEEREERFEEYSDKAHASARAREKHDRQITDALNGQPILVGHHSEKRHRKTLDKLWKNWGARIQDDKRARYWQRRAEATIKNAEYKDRPDVRARRIKKLEAEKRKQERYIAEAKTNTCEWGPQMAYVPRCERWIDHLEGRIAYERTLLEAQGGLALLDPKPRRKGKTAVPLLNLAGFHELTKAQWKRIHADYKGSRVSECKQYRYRVAIIRPEGGGPGALTQITLTDSKQHPAP